MRKEEVLSRYAVRVYVFGTAFALEFVVSPLVVTSYDDFCAPPVVSPLVVRLYVDGSVAGERVSWYTYGVTIPNALLIFTNTLTQYVYHSSWVIIPLR